MNCIYSECIDVCSGGIIDITVHQIQPDNTLKELYKLLCMTFVSGGTIDITVHQIQPDNTLKELYKANGGSWGGTYVDKAFRDLLADIVGNDVMDSLAEGKTSDYFDLFRSVHDLMSIFSY